ncbi:DUF4175 family protein [Chondromyces apiculatus]|uniref:DUF4175 family protein n=1 Tax=Chondromyces apiculatus DSM 436 TaxID=1192034 RepID=A0A017TBC5_9BACT|nr:DUF4175 family protein [Chondromyces apiculatus]EYF06227.1 Hypothetical protein CAP_2105 [Chondromyces apiculatus DSM 436]
MDHAAHHLALARLRALWDAEVRPSTRQALTALAVAGLLAAAHVARAGTPRARILAAAGLAVLYLGLLVRALVVRRRRADPRRTVRKVVGTVDPDLAASTLRALRLAERAVVDPSVGSPSLARLHLDRAIARAPLDRIRARAARIAGRWAFGGLGLAGACVAATALDPLRVLEGLDVLAARAGTAPVPLTWIEEVNVLATPPEYLRQGSEILYPFTPTLQPRGAVVEVHGKPLHLGRTLVLTDGRSEVPFADDGAGGVVARWTLGESATLRIAARFGAVLIPQADEQRVGSIPDDAPRVLLVGTPRTVRLLDEPSISLRYEVSDDHGLREVDLVLRAGTREERRVLSRPAADALADRGGYELRSKDPFFRRVYVPVEIRVEARDNDPVTGPKWGRSEPLIVIPPQVGEPEALRYAAMVEARAALIDLLAERMVQPPPATTGAGAKGGAGHAAQEAAMQEKAVAVIAKALGGDYGGLKVRGRAATLVRGQLTRLARALDAERQKPGRETHDALLAETEGALLAFDAGVRGLGARDSQLVARRLAEVADEAANGAVAVIGGDKAAGAARLDASTLVLDGGGKQLLRLGDLGLDLGELIANDLRRIARARAAEDWPHTELAARDLAARLRKPDPSFMGGGGGGGVGDGHGHGGVEAGGPGTPQPGEGSEADEEAAEIGRELEELARDHAGEVEAVQDSLEQAMSPEEMRALREEARRHAEAIREAVGKLPRSDAPQTSAEGAATSGREQAESMAGALEQGDLNQAVKSGEQAMEALKEAQRRGESAGGMITEEQAGREAGRAAGTLQQELAWAEEALQRLRQAQSEQAREALERSSQREKGLAERARDLQRKGEQGDSSMPEEMLERLSEAEQAMREAEQALREGDGERGLQRQREAQRLLEMSQEPQDESQSEAQRESSDGKRMAKDADVPGKDKHQAPEEFRKRVLEGLGKPSDPRLREAVRRYAEGLLK